MKNIDARINVLELKRLERERVHVLIVRRTINGMFIWRNKEYTPEEFDELKRKHRPISIILDDTREVEK